MHADLSRTGMFRVIAIGKAAHAMVDGLAAIFPSGCKMDGVVSAPTRPANALPGLQYFVSGHPDTESRELAIRGSDSRIAAFLG